MEKRIFHLIYNILKWVYFNINLIQNYHSIFSSYSGAKKRSNYVMLYDPCYVILGTNISFLPYNNMLKSLQFISPRSEGSVNVFMKCNFINHLVLL